MAASTVVVGADFNDTGDQAIRTGLEQLATGLADVMYVVHVLDTRPPLLPPEERPSPPIPDAPFVSNSLECRARSLAEVDGITYRDEQVHIAVRSGEVLTGLMDAIYEHHADLAIVGTHGRRGLDRLLGGSIAETLVRSASCSVLVARSGRT